MWAHYAQNHSGFVVEFDVDKLRDSFPEVGFHDVEYMDEADSSIEQMIARVATTLKPRHAVWLRDAVLARSYFSKHTSWSYENEIRLVASGDEVEDVGGISILFIPLECLASIGVGKNFPDEMVQASQEIADRAGIDWFREVIGKSHPQPYFTNVDGEIFVHNGDGIYGADHKCPSCEEPIAAEAELCPWCAITDDDRLLAARSNPFRMLDSVGALDRYMEGIEQIKKSLR
ncbi:DUF2971 domain-containing protein [Qipengyuania mesophila]|uniref:DUF2971 domain-containing protein n=1 Tax=Qipengyuania mesophila TaxID=2867246 RepID=UPI003518F94E